MDYASPEPACGHCGRSPAAGHAHIRDIPVCHPTSDRAAPDCFRRVIICGEQLGALLDINPKPAGVSRLVTEEMLATADGG